MTRDEAIARARAVVCADPGCDDAEHAMLRGLLDAYDEATTDRLAAMARAESAEERLSAALAVARLVAGFLGHHDAGAGDLDGDASGPDEGDAACVAPEGARVHVVDVAAGAADEERLGQSRERSG